MKKRLPILALLLVAITIFSALVQAAPPAPQSMGDIIKGAWSTLLDIGSLKGLMGAGADNQLFGFIRIAMGIIVFSLLYMGLFFLPSPSARTLISIVLAIISATFMPAQVLGAFATTYASIFALIIIFAPVAGVGYLVMVTPTPNRGIAVIKVLSLFALFWVINQVVWWAGKVAAATGTSFP